MLNFFRGYEILFCFSQSLLPRYRSYLMTSPLILSYTKAHFPVNVFHEITGITDALKKNAHDQNEQTILPDMFLQRKSIMPALTANMLMEFLL